MDLITNEDGSANIYMGPDAPKGKEKNWIPTVAGKAWFPYFRLYSPNRPSSTGLGYCRISRKRSDIATRPFARNDSIGKLRVVIASRRRSNLKTLEKQVIRL